jgi:hypothetical protein
MATFLVLIRGDERRWSAMTPDEVRALDEGHAAFVARAGSAVLRGDALEPSARARTVRAGGDARPLVTDGPFPEMHEVVGGYYLLEAADLDEAAALAAGLPEARTDHTSVEVREVRSVP